MTQEVFDRVKTDSYRDHKTVYSPATGNEGTATTPSPHVVMGFSFNPQSRQLTYTLESKPFWLAEGLIWSGIESAISKARAGK